MADYDPKPNTGTIFRVKEEDKQKSENAADYEGDGKIECPHCKAHFRGWLRLWVRESERTGKKYFGFQFKPKTGRQ